MLDYLFYYSLISIMIGIRITMIVNFYFDINFIICYTIYYRVCATVCVYIVCLLQKIGRLYKQVCCIFIPAASSF